MLLSPYFEPEAVSIVRHDSLYGVGHRSDLEQGDELKDYARLPNVVQNVRRPRLEQEAPAVSM
jgi:hypothetical protein